MLPEYRVRETPWNFSSFHDVVQRGAFEGAFPGITEPTGVHDALVSALNDLTERGIAYSRVGG